eukprot:80755-Prorocentrum_minimum.AAC.3
MQASQLRGGYTYWVLIASWAGLALVRDFHQLPACGPSRSIIGVQRGSEGGPLAVISLTASLFTSALTILSSVKGDLYIAVYTSARFSLKGTALWAPNARNRAHDKRTHLCALTEGSCDHRWNQVGYVFQTLDVRDWGVYYWRLHLPRKRKEEEVDEDGVYWDGVIIDGYEIDCEDWDGVIDGYRRLSARPASHHAGDISHHSFQHARAAAELQ